METFEGAHIPNKIWKNRGYKFDVFLYLIIGVIQTVLAYYIFNRADDHAYFVDLVNQDNIDAPMFSQSWHDFKTNCYRFVFYYLMSPLRWIGAGELFQLLCVRFFILLSFLAGFGWLQRILRMQYPKEQSLENRRAFIILLLMYPGQLAWTASLLRDGLTAALLFFALRFCRYDFRFILAMLLFTIALMLRPEYSIILILLTISFYFNPLIRFIKSRTFTLICIIMVFSVLSHSWQLETAQFSQLAFENDGKAYPLINSEFDILGYIRRFFQSLIDPIPLDEFWKANLFGISESAFFIYLLCRAKPLLEDRSTFISALVMALLFSLWIFSYFEIYVSGFSRHRLFIEVFLIALITVVIGKKYN